MEFAGRLRELLWAAALLLTMLGAALCLMGRCSYATLLGSEGAYFAAGVLLYALVDGVLGLVAVASAALGASTTVMLKELFTTPRPPRAPPSAVGPGFPSGHATVTAAFWLGLGFYIRDKRLIAAGAALSLLVAYTRVAVHAHTVPDVIGGLAVGAAAAALVAAAAREWGAVGALIASGPWSLLASLVATLVWPGYVSAQRLLGIAAAVTVVGDAAARWSRVLDEHCLSHAPRLAALAASLAFMAAGMAVDHLVSHVLGFALFAGGVAVSRTLVCRTRR